MRTRTQTDRQTDRQTERERERERFLERLSSWQPPVPNGCMDYMPVRNKQIRKKKHHGNHCHHHAPPSPNPTHTRIFITGMKLFTLL